MIAGSLFSGIEGPLAIDLCAGAGGLALGLQRAGYRTLGVELDPDAVATHRASVGPCEELDVRLFDGTAHRAELVAGGVPCQPFSISGAREGTAREDGRLWLELVRVADESQARAILLENVHGFTTWREDGSLFIARVLRTLERAGWHVACRVLDAADYGVPQNRNRVFIVGFRSAAARAAFRWPSPTHAPPGDMFLPPYRTVRDALGLGSDSYASGRRLGAKGWQGERALDVDAPATTVTTTTAELLCAVDRPAPNADYRAQLAAELADAGLLDRSATTVAADPRLPRAGHHDRQQNGAVRLRPNDLALLQGFPPTFVFTGKLGSQHRQVGNAVPPKMGEVLGSAIRRAEAWGQDETPARAGGADR